MEEDLKKVVNWATSIGLEVRHKNTRTTKFVSNVFPFLPNIWIEYGIIYYNNQTLAGNLLHDLGHLAVTPSILRSYLCGELLFDYEPDAVDIIEKLEEELIRTGKETQQWKAYLNGNEQAVIAWSFAAARECKVDDFLPFEQGFTDANGNSDGKHIYNSLLLSCGQYQVFHPGISGLYHSNMLKNKCDFPQLNYWVQK